jgi:hypothetical protein
MLLLILGLVILGFIVLCWDKKIAAETIHSQE